FIMALAPPPRRLPPQSRAHEQHSCRTADRTVPRLASAMRRFERTPERHDRSGATACCTSCALPWQPPQQVSRPSLYLLSSRRIARPPVVRCTPRVRAVAVRFHRCSWSAASSRSSAGAVSVVAESPSCGEGAAYATSRAADTSEAVSTALDDEQIARSITC